MRVSAQVFRVASVTALTTMSLGLGGCCLKDFCFTVRYLYTLLKKQVSYCCVQSPEAWDSCIQGVQRWDQEVFTTAISTYNECKANGRTAIFKELNKQLEELLKRIDTVAMDDTGRVHNVGLILAPHELVEVVAVAEFDTEHASASPFLVVDGTPQTVASSGAAQQLVDPTFAGGVGSPMPAGQPVVRFAFDAASYVRVEAFGETMTLDVTTGSVSLGGAVTQADGSTVWVLKSFELVGVIGGDQDDTLSLSMDVSSPHNHLVLGADGHGMLRVVVVPRLSDSLLGAFPSIPVYLEVPATGVPIGLAATQGAAAGLGLLTFNTNGLVPGNEVFPTDIASLWYVANTPPDPAMPRPTLPTDRASSCADVYPPGGNVSPDFADVLWWQYLDEGVMECERFWRKPQQ